MNFKVLNVGQFKEASVEFGDLTLLVGAQGTGKSIFLQLFKLSQDQDYIKNTLWQFGQRWNDETSMTGLMEAYFGRGMGQIWGAGSSMLCDGKDVELPPSRWQLHHQYKPPTFHADGIMTIPYIPETVYYIPAQRVVTMPEGWPQPYRSYTPRVPFALKNFSELIRLHLEGLDVGETLFPIAEKIKKPILKIFDKTIFHRASISLNASHGQNEVRLNVDGDENRAISYMAWSTGQREFLPLLLGYYQLLENARMYKTVIIEEPEMGLHPMGIFAVMALVLDILSRGYKVVISTHSSNVLDIVWAMKAIKRQRIDESQKIGLIAKLFDLTADDEEICDMFGKALGLTFKTHCFYYENGSVLAKDISSLDPWDEDEIVAGWGGLAAYSGRVSDVVAEAVGMSPDA